MHTTRMQQIADSTVYFLQKKNILVEKIILFGSCAQGTDTEQSDIDVAIVSPHFTGKNIFQKTALVQGLSSFLIQTYHIPFDLVYLSPEEWHHADSPLVEYIRQGKELYPAA